MLTKEFSLKLDEIKLTLSTLLRVETELLKDSATTKTESDLATNLQFAIDNALDIATTTGE